MASYVYRCEAGHTFESPTYGLSQCPEHPYILKRDYRSENVGIAVARLRMEREEGGSGAIRDLFLPTAEEYKSPEDPDGSKGIREWNERHAPKPGNKAPMRPEMPLHSKEIL